MQKKIKNDKKHYGIAITATIVLILIMYWIFRDSWPKICTQILNARKIPLLLLVLLGNIYIFLDGLVLRYMIKRNGEPCSIGEAIHLAYMVVFFNVTTFAAGTKPAQIYYLYEHNKTAPGKSFGMLTMEYVSHKLTIVLYAALMFCIYRTPILKTLKSSSSYLLAGFGISIVVLSFLTAFCVNDRLAPWLSDLCRRIKKETWRQKAQKIMKQMEEFSKAGRMVLRDKKGWMGLIVRNILKMSCLYLLPATAAYAVTGERLPLSAGACVAYAAVMQLLIGVIPSSGGTGSTEIVFMLLFKDMLGKTSCGAALILYRMATYYLPFLVSIPLVLAGKKAVKH